MKSFIAALFLITPLAHANGQFWHPEASEVILAAPDGATVCQWWPSPISFQPAVWECEDIYRSYTRDPFVLPLNRLGPVKVFARWAYARDAEGRLVAMQPSAY